MYIIAVFKSRKETMDFKCEMDMKNIKNCTVNTPRQLSAGCGISLKFETRGYTYAKCLINQCNYRTFAGFFRYNDEGRLINV